MKLSDIKGERVLDVISELIDPVMSIARDERVAESLKGSKGDTSAAAARLIPILVNEHRDDMVAIMSSINGVSPEEYRQNMTMTSIMRDAYEVLTDKELLSFLG